MSSSKKPIKKIVKPPKKLARKIEIQPEEDDDIDDVVEKSVSDVIPIITTISIPIDDVFKIHIFDNNGSISKIYIFSGGAKIPLTSLFNELEVAYIKGFIGEENIFFSKFQLHRDDSIHMIKRKIINEIGVSNISYDELYIYTNIVESIDLINIYQRATKNESIAF